MPLCESTIIWNINNILRSTPVSAMRGSRSTRLPSSIDVYTIGGLGCSGLSTYGHFLLFIEAFAYKF